MSKSDAETEKRVNESRKYHAETEKFYAERMKLLEDTIKSRCERQRYPTVVMIAALGAAAALGKLFL